MFLNAVSPPSISEDGLVGRSRFSLYQSVFNFNAAHLHKKPAVMLRVASGLLHMDCLARLADDQAGLHFERVDL